MFSGLLLVVTAWQDSLTAQSPKCKIILSFAGSWWSYFGRFLSYLSYLVLVLVVSLVSVVSFRLFRWFRFVCFGRFVSLFRVLVHAGDNSSRRIACTYLYTDELSDELLFFAQARPTDLFSLETDHPSPMIFALKGIWTSFWISLFSLIFHFVHISFL